MTEIENIKESCIRNKAFKIVDAIEKLEQENFNLNEALKHIQYLNQLKEKDYEKRMSDNATIIVNLHNQIEEGKADLCEKIISEAKTKFDDSVILQLLIIMNKLGVEI